MNNEKDKDLDDLFKKGLKDPVENAGYMEEDWAAMEQMLDGGKKRRGIVFWLPVLSGVAALFLLVLGWWALNTKTTGNNQSHSQAVVKHQQPADTGTNGGSAGQQKDLPQKGLQQKTVNIPGYASNGGANNKGVNAKSFFTLSATKSRRGTAGAGREQDLMGNKQQDGQMERSDGLLMAYSATPVMEQASLNARVIDTPNPLVSPTAVISATENNKIKIRRQPAFRTKYAISVLAAPDINGVSSFQQSKVGTNVGLLFSAGVSKKLTISTGAIYSVKPYMTSFDNYHTAFRFTENPVNVTADCRMLDIPINIGYQVYHKHQSKISIGTGLSSYIMLHESYKFNYAEYSDGNPSTYTVPNSNKYFFGVLNLNATYQRQLNSKVGISVQPYVKLPLTNIGYSQVRLQTTGVAVGLTWNLNSLSKP